MGLIRSISLYHPDVIESVGDLSPSGSVVHRDGGRGARDCAQRPVPLRRRGGELGRSRPVADC